MGPTARIERPAYHGKRYIAYARCAAAEGAAAKLEEQVRQIREFGDRNDMKCVGEVRLAGVSGGPPAMRDDLRKLLSRKREQNDFDVLIMKDFARLTRAGLTEGLKVEAEFARCGVRIIYATEVVGAEDERRGKT